MKHFGTKGRDAQVATCTRGISNQRIPKTCGTVENLSKCSRLWQNRIHTAALHPLLATSEGAAAALLTMASKLPYRTQHSKWVLSERVKHTAVCTACVVCKTRPKALRTVPIKAPIEATSYTSCSSLQAWIGQHTADVEKTHRAGLASPVAKNAQYPVITMTHSHGCNGSWLTATPGRWLEKFHHVMSANPFRDGKTRPEVVQVRAHVAVQIQRQQRTTRCQKVSLKLPKHTNLLQRLKNTN